ncbi:MULTISPECIES: acyltransferase [unclassified Sulfurospirillum]|uniref:acyltransferase family protein n=1 Tax=unclassified Sulfurospirillum TaxID=2618290 RepID=UPI0005044201|nr:MULTISPECIES: acyltransferase [unclassified Sulfurospirillum]KFL34043.1 hypothetical protein JU57_07985 [Sulfurospirillum sp. SCADC]
MQISRENNFDLIRLILAILVFFAHWNILTAQSFSLIIFHLSGYAVDMFFIVSGFLIFWSFDVDQNKKHFFIKRFFRLFPLYAILIFSQALFFLFFADNNVVQIAKYFFSNILFLNFLNPSVGDMLSHLQVDAINGSLWTVKNEVIFYSLVPMIFVLYKKFGTYFLIFLYLLSVMYLLVVDYFGNVKLLVQFPAQLRLFITGILLYIFFDTINRKNIFIYSGTSFILIVLFGENSYFHYLFYPIFLGCLVVLLAFFLKTFEIHVDFSYSFYILHFPVIQIFLYFKINSGNPLFSFMTLFGLVLFLSYISEKYIEKRFIQIGKNIIQRNSHGPN